MRFTRDCSGKSERLKRAIDEADAVVVGAGAGLSAAAGYDYGGERFRQYFSDFEEKYSFHDMYSGGFYPYETLEEYWAYWSRYVLINRYHMPPMPVYKALFDLVEGKDYFVVTTNVDHCFQRFGFDKERLFYTQGDYGLFQCSVPCHDKTYDNEGVIRRMVAEQRDGKIPSGLIPRCPLCGRPMTMNLRSDHTFVQDEGWYAAKNRYEAFLKEHKKSRVLFLELGVGGNTPAIIKYPFWRLTAQNPNATYACVNLDEAFCPPQIGDRSILCRGDIAEIIKMPARK